LPKVHERLHLVKIHEGYVVNMSESLPVQNNCRGQALVAHPLRERLMIWAIIVDFVSIFLEGYTALAFLVRLMLSLAFLFDL
jgi:hypothetical protein